MTEHPIPENLRSMYAALARVGPSEKSCNLQYAVALELIERIAAAEARVHELEERLDDIGDDMREAAERGE